MVEYGSVLDGYIVPGEPLVSVNVITYNHGKYIRQCLDGILMQKVNFPYEVLVHDDASPDDTADIIREYEARFPTVIKPIYQTENQYSQGKAASRFNIDRAKGKYIAHCEGDDYWTDPGKLQMQVDFLEVHEEYVACSHGVNTINEHGEIITNQNWYDIERDEDYQLIQLENKFKLCGHINSIVSKNLSQLPHYSEYSNYLFKGSGDVKLSLYLSGCGNIRRFERKMSVYRHITSFGTSCSARYNNTNRSYFMLSETLDSINIMHVIFGIDIDLKRRIAYAIIVAIVYLLLHPNHENLTIFKKVIVNVKHPLVYIYVIEMMWKMIIKKIYNPIS